MTERLRLVALTLLAGALAVLMVAGAAAADDDVPTPSDDPTPTESPSETPTPAPTESGAVTVDDAVLRWSLNNESNNKAFAPNTYNFFSAGLLPDPGQGGVTIKEAQWRQATGNTSIEKWDGSSWRPATWAGLKTDSAGVALTSPTEGRFSNHAFVMRGGTGTVDVAAGTASVAWDADVTVLYYSGMSFFHVTDPVLQVVDGRGTLTAVLHGYASSQENPDVWAEVAGSRVTIATLPSIDLSDALGFVATPAYSGVVVTGVPQVTTGPDAGAFPQSFIAYLDQLGAAAFWYSSGASTDPYKKALPLSVSYDASAPVVVPEPSDQDLAWSAPPVPEPTAVPPPSVTSPPVVRGVAAPVAMPPPAVVPPRTTVVADAALILSRPATDLRLAAAPAAPEPAVVASTTRLWWLGGGLLLAAGLVLLVPVPSPSPKGHSR
jgi:hypothetical protein